MTAPTGSNAAFEREARHRKTADQHEPEAATRHPLLRLQNQAGNAAVARLLQRMQDPSVQRQDDSLDEEEEELTQATHDPSLQRQEAEEEEDEMVLGAHDEGAEEGAVGLAGGPLAAESADRIDSMRGAGTGLNESIRAAAEPALGVDLESVRVHQDSASDSLARSMTAKAFTSGSDVFLRSDVSPSDSHLMAHELTHVVQQSEGVAGASNGQRMTVGAADDPLEHEADSVADAITSGAPANREIEDR
ncbi:MAG: DUF4157 domain-containing protein [Tepidiformaceae bacterium]